MNNIEMDDEIKDYLASYKVDFPHEEEIEVSVEYIMSNVQPIESSAAIFQKRAKSLLRNCTREVLNFGLLFWGFNGMFLLLGLFSLIQRQTDPYLTAFVLAPLPFLVGMIEILKSKDEGLTELELTLKYNAGQIFITRLLVTGAFNLVINLVISLITIGVNPDIIFTKLLAIWTIPYLLVTGLAFIFAMYTKGTVASSVTLATWFAVCYGLIQVEVLREFLLKINIPVISGSLFVGIVVWVISIVKVKRMGEHYGTQNG